MLPGEVKSEAHRLQCFRIIDTRSPRLLKQQPFLSVIVFVPLVPNVENVERRCCVEKRVVSSLGISWSIHFRPRLELGGNAFPRRARRENRGAQQRLLDTNLLSVQCSSGKLPRMISCRCRRGSRRSGSRPSAQLTWCWLFRFAA